MPRASGTASDASTARAMMHVASPPSAMTSSASANRRPSLPNSSSSRSVATMSAVHRVDDLASSDELKVYKDEGDADDENKSSAENLDEEKRGLLTETEQGKLLEAKAAFYSRIGSKLLATSDGGDATAAALRMSDYYGSLRRPVPFPPFFNPYHTHHHHPHQYQYPPAAPAPAPHQYHTSSYCGAYGAADAPPAPTPPGTSPVSAAAAAAAAAAVAAAGFGRVSSLLTPPPSQCFYGPGGYGSSPYDHFAQPPATHPHGLHLGSRSTGFPHQTPSPYRFPSAFLSTPSQFTNPFLSPEFTQTSCFDPLSANSHCGYGPLPFGVPCLSPAAAALGGFAQLPRLGTDYFSPSQPGISSTYPGISHPALVSSYTSPGKETGVGGGSGGGVPLPLCCSSPDEGRSSRSLHSWYPRHCPAASSSSLSSSHFARLPATASSQGGESSSTSLSSPEPTPLHAADFHLNDRQQQQQLSTGTSRHSGLVRCRQPLGAGSALRSRQTSTASSLLTAKHSKLHHRHHHHHHHLLQQQNHVKKPLNAFMLFMKEMRSKVIDECTLKESAAINQILGRKWHSLDRAEQARYYEMARREKLMHRQLFPGWSARDNYAILARKAKRKLLHHQPQRPTAQQSTTTSIGGANDRDNANAKKCRARYGLEHQNRWCKPCRRKKRCIRFLDNAAGGGDDTSGGSAPPVAADSTSDAPFGPGQDGRHHASPSLSVTAADPARNHHRAANNRDADVVSSKPTPVPPVSVSGGGHGPWPSPVSCGGGLLSPATAASTSIGYHRVSPPSQATR